MASRYQNSPTERRRRFQRLKRLIMESPYIHTFNVWKENHSSFHAEGDFHAFRQKGSPEKGKFYKVSSIKEAVVAIEDLKDRPFLNENRFMEDYESGFLFGQETASKVVKPENISRMGTSRILDAVFKFMEETRIHPTTHSTSIDDYYRGISRGVYSYIEKNRIAIVNSIATKRADIGIVGLGVGNLGDTEVDNNSTGGQERDQYSRRQRAFDDTEEEPSLDSEIDKTDLTLNLTDDQQARMQKSNILDDHNQSTLPAPTNPDWGGKGIKL